MTYFDFLEFEMSEAFQKVIEACDLLIRFPVYFLCCDDFIFVKFDIFILICRIHWSHSVDSNLLKQSIPQILEVF